MNLSELSNRITEISAFWVLLTILGYQLGVWLFHRFKRNSLCQPILISIAILGFALVYFEHSYQLYFEQVQIIHFMLGPATVALAIPLYSQIHLISRLLVPITLSLVVGGSLALLAAVFCAKLLGVSEASMLALSTKSITTPIALGVADIIGASPELAAGIIIVTGVIAAVIGLPLLRLAGFNHPAAQGLAMGFSGHAIATTRALDQGQECGGFAALGMGLMGVSTAIILPLVINQLI